MFCLFIPRPSTKRMIEWVTKAAREKARAIKYKKNTIKRSRSMPHSFWPQFDSSKTHPHIFLNRRYFFPISEHYGTGGGE